MMVAQWIGNDEYESESFCAFGNLEAEERQHDCNDEQEQQDVDRFMAEIDLHRRIYDHHCLLACPLQLGNHNKQQQETTTLLLANFMA
jgi:hypothetical protein